MFERGRAPARCTAARCSTPAFHAPPGTCRNDETRTNSVSPSVPTAVRASAGTALSPAAPPVLLQARPSRRCLIRVDLPFFCAGDGDKTAPLTFPSFPSSACKESFCFCLERAGVRGGLPSLRVHSRCMAGAQPWGLLPFRKGKGSSHPRPPVLSPCHRG